MAKPVTGDELAREFLTVLSTELGVVGENLLACMRDGASVNGKAMRTIEIMYPKVMNITCFSHALDLVGSKFVTPNLEKFTKHWFTIVQHSHKAKLLWRGRTGQSLKSYSSTRWWSRWECQKQLMLLWGNVPPFLTNCISDDSATKNCKKLLDLLKNTGTELVIELSVLVDAGEPFVKACYNLEGDGQLAPICYDILSAVKASIQVKHWPNTEAVAKRLEEEFNTPGLKQNLMDCAADCVQPGFDYFLDRALVCSESF